MKLWQRWLLIAVGLVAVVVVLQTTVFAPRPIEVDVAEVQTGVVEDAVTNSQAGTVKARRRSRLGAERAGRIVRIPHREGAAVERGEVLVLLDTSTAETRLDLARRDREVQTAALGSARATYALAKIQFERTTELAAQGLVAQGDLDQATARHDEARAAFEAAEATLGRARANVQLAEDDLAHLRVTAPYEGVVAQRLVEVGESVVPGQPVIEIVSLDDLYVSASIDEIDIGRLREGQPARITLDPYKDASWSGAVGRVFPVVDDRLEQNRTLQVEVDLAPDPAKPTPRPGTSADVAIVIDTRDGVLRVPTFAILDGRRVLVVEKGKAVARDITTGLRNWEWTEVREGLEAGETVITSLDKQGVKAGVKVRPRTDEPGPASSQGS